MRFEDKVVIVTGAASGLGEASAIEFAKEGAKVVLSDVSETGKEISDKLNADGHDTAFIKADVASEKEVKNLVSKTVELYGKLDVMFANAGINIEGQVHELEFEDWKKVLDINLNGVYFCDKYAIQQFKKQGTGGAIVNMGSIHSHVARTGLTAYSASKGGVKMLTQQIAAHYTKDGIRCNTICPAYIRTPIIDTVPKEIQAKLESLHPIGRLGEPIEVAKAVLFLASDDASFISGSSLLVDGGFTAV